VIEEMYEVRDYVLNQTVVVEQSIELIDEVVDTFVDFAGNTESYSSNITAGIAEIDDLLAYGLHLCIAAPLSLTGLFPHLALTLRFCTSALPSYDMGGDRDDTNEQAKVEAFYAPFSFADYQGFVDAVNAELALMTTVPTPFNTHP